MKKTAKRIWLSVLMLAVLFGAVVQSGCGAKNEAMAMDTMEMSTSSNGMSYMSDDMYYEEEVMVEESAAEAPMMEEGQMVGGSANETAGQTQKLILNIYIDMEVENPSLAMDEIITYAQNAGGYLLYSEDYYNAENNSGGAHVTIRVPSGSSQKMEEYLKTLGKINSSSAHAEDVTGEYYDLQARIQQGELEVETLEGLLAECTTVEEVLMVRDQLSWAQSDLEGMKGRMRVLNELTGYDTIEVHLYPIYSMVNVDEGERFITGSEFLLGISQGFENSVRGFVNGCANFVIFLIENLLQLLVWAIIGLAIFLIIRRIIRKSHKRKLERMEAKRALLEAEKAAQEENKQE